MSSGVTTLMGPGLILLIMLAYRMIGAIELWLIMRSLPRADRVTAAVAFVAARSSEALSTGNKAQIPIARDREAISTVVKKARKVP